jgi:hypothetical protein
VPYALGLPPQQPVQRRGLPHWLIALVVTAMVLLMGVGAVAAIRDARRPVAFPALPTPERAHDVVYWFTAAGTANEDIDVTYTGADKRDEKLSLPGVTPGWRQEVQVEEGANIIVLSVSASSSDFNYSIRCQVEIDGFIEETQEGRTCIIYVYLPLEDRPRQTAAPPPSPKPPAPPKTPPACRFVSPQQAQEVVRTSANVFKTVLNAGEENGTCYYLFDADSGAIRFAWQRGEKDIPPPGSTRVSGESGRVYWLDYGGRQGVLEAHLAKGIFRVEIFFIGLDIDAKSAALGILAAARPKLR